MPAFCHGDYPAMEWMHAELIRKHICANSNVCDKWIVGDKSSYFKGYPKKKLILNYQAFSILRKKAASFAFSFDRQER